MPTPRPHTADCIFCAIIRGDAPATFVHQDEVILAFMDTRPVQPGHLLGVAARLGELPFDGLDATAVPGRLLVEGRHLGLGLRCA